jgi:hypothetical protein
VSLYGATCFSLLIGITQESKYQKINKQLKVAVARNINTNNVINIKHQQHKTKKIEATRQQKQL